MDECSRAFTPAHGDQVKYVNDDLRCYCTANKKDGKVAIITGGGTGHLPLFLGYVGDGLLERLRVGGVFQSPSAEQIYNVSKEVEAGAGILYLYGNYTGDIMNFDMAAEMCEMDDIETRSIVGADDVNSNADPAVRRGVAGIFFMYKCAGAKAAKGGTLDEVLAAAQKAKDNTRTVGFALTPCIIPRWAIPTSPWARTRWPWAWASTANPACGTAPSRPPTSWPRNPWTPCWATCPWRRARKCAC